MTERKLKRGLLCGEEEAIRQVIEENYEAIYRYCYYHLGERMAAQDAAQDVFLKFLSSLGQYREWGKIKNYLYVIARNTVKDKRKKKQEIVLEHLPETGMEREEPMEEQVLIRLAFRELSREEQELIILRYYQDLRLKDIAKVMGMPISNVRYHLKKAEQRLKEVLL